MTEPALVLKAPAKINLCLRVRGRRPDGFHDIESLFFQVDLYDRLAFYPAPELELCCSGFDAGNPTDNLVLQAARRLAERYGVREGVRLELTKNIPSGAGLGGGSSDAATALSGLNRFWNLGLSLETLHGEAEALGSDVPFFLYGPAARVSGRGEVVKPFTPAESFHAVLVKPGCSVSTAWAYRALSLTKNRQNNRLSCFGLAGGDLLSVASALWNDFETIVFERFPEIGEIKARLVAQGSCGALMSGSGAAVVGLFEDPEVARQAATAFPECWSAQVRTLVRV